jgi:Phage-related protein
LGTLKTAIQNLLGWDSASNYNRIINANSVVFSSFGKDVTASDIVKTAVHRVAEEVSKCSLKSVVEMQNPRRIVVADDDINAVLSARVNPLCGLKDFLYKVAYITLLNRNCFIYWAYDEVPIKDTDSVRRVTRGFYPIECASIKLYYQNGEMRAELTGNNGAIVLDLPYSDLIHVRLGYGANQYLGGDTGGRADFRAMLGNLQTLSVIKESVPKALEASLSLKGILSMKTVADADKKQITRTEFESHLFDSKYGIVATDYEADFQPINISATDIPSNILSFLRDEILSPFGVSLPIYLGKYTDDEYTAFYQTAVEGLLLEIAEAFKITLFTPRQLAYGRSIKYYDKIVQSLSFARRQAIAEMTKDDALLSRDERRELLGYDPDGEPTRVSLNYIDVSIANQYQLTSLSQGKKPTATPVVEKNKEDDK